MKANNTAHAASIALCGFIVAGIAGCKATVPPQQKASYSETLNSYYEGRPLCLWSTTVKFPVEDATPAQIDELGLDALRDAGLVIERPAARTAPAGSHTYFLSEEGRAALNPDVFNQGAGNFCYGRRKVSSIDSARQNSRSTELVDYRYALPSPAAWASNPSIESAFPQVESELGGVHSAEATLLDTTDGWEVSGTPATIVPLATRPHGTTLAKARHLLHRLKRRDG